MQNRRGWNQQFQHYNAATGEPLVD